MNSLKIGISGVRGTVGQAFISEAMMENRAVIGGEGNGVVVYPRINYAHRQSRRHGAHPAPPGRHAPHRLGNFKRAATLFHDKREARLPLG